MRSVRSAEHARVPLFSTQTDSTAPSLLFGCSFPRMKRVYESSRRRAKDELVRISKTDGIAPGRARWRKSAGGRFALSNVIGRFYAIDNVCTHRSALLVERDG